MLYCVVIRGIGYGVCKGVGGEVYIGFSYEVQEGIKLKVRDKVLSIKYVKNKGNVKIGSSVNLNFERSVSAMFGRGNIPGLYIDVDVKVISGSSELFELKVIDEVGSGYSSRSNKVVKFVKTVL